MVTEASTGKTAREIAASKYMFRPPTPLPPQVAQVQDHALGDHIGCSGPSALHVTCCHDLQLAVGWKAILSTISGITVNSL